ncbi:hypothetical protein K502DRAFT_323226 [Neoconidiobolus thromboides FSU 785]|nr:hypothetical protein K502DRAFT_323226 [Neoconidiobolus thromboides FSU 785]
MTILGTIRHNSAFEIQLPENEVLFYGPASECSGKILQGTLMVTANDSFKVRSISLHFIGRAQVHWTTGAGTLQRVCSENRILIEKRWTFLQSQKKYHTLTPGHYFYDFEITLPGDLPASLITDYASIEYKFKAILERPTFSLNYTSRQYLTIKRALLPSAPVLTELIYLSDTWNNKLHYEVYSPNKAYGLAEIIPLQFKLLALEEGLKVQTITCLLKEYITVWARGEDGNLASKCDGRVQARSSKTLHSQDSAIETVINIQIPSIEDENCHAFMEYELIKVEHKIKVLLVLSDSQDRLHRILAKVGVVVLSIKRQDTLNALPLYQSLPQEEVIPIIGNGFTSNTLDGMEEDEPHLPSYKTQWCPLPTLPSTSSLPGYNNSPALNI